MRTTGSDSGRRSSRSRLRRSALDDNIDPDLSAREHEQAYEEERKQREEAEARQRAQEEARQKALLPYKTFAEIDISGRKGWIIKSVFAKGEISYWIGPPGSLELSLTSQRLVLVPIGSDWRDAEEVCLRGGLFRPGARRSRRAPLRGLPRPPRPR